jgi:hypothetical protein
VIPHRSLHSVSGTISQALKIHGPNFGVGGGPHGAAKAMLAAGALLECEPVSGVWVILTGWNWEPGLDKPEPVGPNGHNGTNGHAHNGHNGQNGHHALNGHHEQPAVCRAVALALTKASDADVGTRLRISATPVAGHELANGASALPPFTLESACNSLENGRTGSFSWRLDCGGTVALDNTGADAEKRS